MKSRLTKPQPGPLRRHWGLKPGTVFLNHGSFGACPKAVLRHQRGLRQRLEAEPVQFLWRHYDELLAPARLALARFLGARPEDVVFTTNATSGVNAVVRSLKFKRGEEILTTSLDYNACRNVLIEAAAWTGARLVIAPVPFPIRHEDDVVAAVLAAVTPRTRLVMLDHVTSDTGLILPVARLIRELEKRGVDTLVDGAHAPGMIPLNLRQLRPAYYTGNLHKWVCAPKGAAFLWVREDRQEGIQPAVISHGNNRPRPGHTPFQDRFDWTGTFDPTAWLCVGEALHWMETLLPGGWKEVRARNHELVRQARRLLCESLEVTPPGPENMLGSLATLPLPDFLQNRPRSGKIDAEQLALYDRFGIEVPFSRIGPEGRRHLRISAQLYNTLEEYAYLAAALRQV